MSQPARALPRLYLFAISHYCEKARWALERAGIAHTCVSVVPGAHTRLAKRLGVPERTVPILVLGDGVAIQGSAKIAAWAATHAPSALPLGDPGVEARLDRVLGAHVTLYYYSEALVEHPKTVRPIFVSGLGLLPRLMFWAAWSQVQRAMIEGMQLSEAQWAASRAAIMTELDWLDALLGDGRAWLGGERPGREDIAAASLLAPLVLPPEHPIYGTLVLPPRVGADCAAWRERPSFALVRRLYREHRHAHPAHAVA
ncbi:MAG: glutathione S-transferase family protein [Pseudomonadota bacterium]